MSTSLRRTLHGAAAAPARPLDLDHLLARGRRRRRAQRVGAAAGALVSVGVVASVGLAVAQQPTPGPGPAAPPAATTQPAPTGPPPPSRCDPQPLPVPAGAFQSVVTGGDPTGRFLLGTALFETAGEDWNEIRGRRAQTVIWDDGGLSEVDVPGFSPQLQDVNSSGVAVGVSFPAPGGDGSVTAWVYDGGEVSALAGGPVAGSVPLAINEQGVITGATSDERPAVWRSPTAAPEVLPVPGPTWTAVVTAADADGTVVGHGLDTAAPREPGVLAARTPLLWRPDGSLEVLSNPPDDAIGTIEEFTPGSIHDGVIIGSARRAHHEEGFSSHPVYAYDLASGTFTSLSDGTVPVAYTWSPTGWLAGANPDGELVLWSAGTGAIGLPSLSGEAIDWTADGDLNTVSDDGRVVAGSVPQQPHAVRWHCS